MTITANATTRTVNGYAITLTMDGWVVDLGNGRDTCTFAGSIAGFERAAALANRM